MIKRPYQNQALSNIWQGWSLDDILMLVIGTGGGKTFIFSDVSVTAVKELKGRVMIVAHKEELITQGAATMMQLALDAGIVKRGYPLEPHKPVQVASIQTLIRRPQFMKDFKPDYLIFDEGHHAQPDNSYGTVIAAYPSAKILLVTATPYRLSGAGFEYLHPHKKTKLILGPSVPALIADGWLVPIRYYAASIPDLSKVPVKGGDYVEEDLAKAMELAPLVDSYLEHANGLQGICFAVNVEHSIKIVQQYLYAGVPAVHVDGNTPDEERRKIFADYRAGLIKVVVNVGIVTEGTDFPNCHFVQYAAPTKSLSKTCQCGGRVTRALPGIVDNPAYTTAEQRKAAIAASPKPYGIILDNAGIWLEHMLLPHRDFINWEEHFKGTKKQKKQETETMEMLVFVAEDESGKRVRARVPEEIAGMRLIEITTEPMPPKFDARLIKAFDKRLEAAKMRGGNGKIGYAVYYDTINDLKKKNVQLTEQFWQHVKTRLVDEPLNAIDLLDERYEKKRMPIPPNVFVAERDRLERQSISLNFWKKEFSQYEKLNRERLALERFGK